MTDRDRQRKPTPGEGIGSFSITASPVDGFGANGFSDRSFAELYKNEYFGVFRFLARKLGNDHEAQEITQDAFVKVWKLNEVDSIDNLKAFVYRVASNLAIDALRRKNVEDRYKGQLTVDESERMRLAGVIENADQYEALARKQQVEAIMIVIQSLPRNCQIAFILNRFKGLNYNEVACRMGVSKSMIEKHVSKALAALRADGLL